MHNKYDPSDEAMTGKTPSPGEAQRLLHELRLCRIELKKIGRAHV